MYALGDFANIPAPDGRSFPQLQLRRPPVRAVGGEEHQAEEIAGKPPKPFHYHDKGIMAMIGRNAAIAEMGEHRHELHGPIAFASWLGVHAWLMTGTPHPHRGLHRLGLGLLLQSRGPQVLDRSDAARIDWDDEDDAAGAGVPSAEDDMERATR